MDERGVIGNAGTLPWRLPDDLRHFKAITMGKPIIMGRRNYADIGRPLPGRRNIVLTRSPDYSAEGIEVAHSLEETLQLLAGCARAMVIGGAEIYALFLPLCSELFLTRVHAKVAGDVCMPAIDRSQWQLLESEPHPADEKHVFAFTFEHYRRHG